MLIGLLASVAGLFLGLGLAKALAALSVAAGTDLPDGGAVLATRTVVVSLLVGVVITLAAGLAPALRATRIPPVAACAKGRRCRSRRWPDTCRASPRRRSGSARARSRSGCSWAASA